MKKVLSVFLAILMMLSVVTVAFAADEQEETTTVVDATEEETTTGVFGTEELPDWAVKVLIKVGPKIAKPIIKIVMVFVKLLFKFGLIDSDKVIGDISNAFTTTVPAATSTEAVAIA